MGDLDFVVCASLGYDILKSTILRVRKAIEERIAKMEGAKEFINRTYYSGEVVALIQTHDQIETCLTKRLRQEYVKKWKVDVQFIMKRFDEWMKNQPTGEKRFYVLFTDENTGPMGNDGWGDNTLWECSLTHEGVLSGTCVVSIPQ